MYLIPLSIFVHNASWKRQVEHNKRDQKWPLAIHETDLRAVIKFVISSIGWTPCLSFHFCFYVNDENVKNDDWYGRITVFLSILVRFMRKKTESEKLFIFHPALVQKEGTWYFLLFTTLFNFLVIYYSALWK